MADAPASAPAAPAPSGGAPAAPAQLPTGPAPAAASPATPAAPAERVAKPIPPGRLPGVFPDEGDPFPAGPSSDSAPSSATPARGPDGRFLAGASSSPAAADGEHTLEPAPTPEPAKPQKFTFAGEEFESQAAAEQNFKTLRGQYRPVQQLARSLGGVDKIVPQFAQAAESARSWKAEHDKVKAELEALQSGKQPAAAPAADGAADAPAPESADVDWELYAEVKRLATEGGEPWKAEQWLIEQVRKADHARYEKLLAERFAPLDAQQEQAAKAQQTETLFGAMAGYTNSDGSPAFPELGDPTASYEVGKTWASLGLPPDSALTPQGAMAAIALYRMVKAFGSQAKPAAPAAPPAAPPAPPAPTDAVSAAGVDGGKPLVASVPGNGHAPSAEAARILAGLRQAQAGSRAGLGFDA